jgi:hypothetical protein
MQDAFASFKLLHRKHKAQGRFVREAAEEMRATVAFTTCIFLLSLPHIFSLKYMVWQVQVWEAFL